MGHISANRTYFDLISSILKVEEYNVVLLQSILTQKLRFGRFESLSERRPVRLFSRFGQNEKLDVS